MPFVWNVPAASDQVITTQPDDYLVAINAVIVANSGGAGAKWEVALYNSSSPKYIILRRKNGDPGRIIIFGQNGSTPNAAATYGSPTASILYVGYSATSTVNTADASYLSGAPLAASDYMPGMRCMPQAAATWRVNYAEHDDGVVILFSETSNGLGSFGAGELVEDLAAAPVSAVWGNGSGSGLQWATTNNLSGSLIPSAVGADASYSSTNAGLLLRTGGVNRQAFRAQSLATGVAAKLDNLSGTIAYFLPILLVFHNRDTTLNIAGKMRQIDFGPLCDRETSRSGGGINAYGHQASSSGTADPGIWFVDDDI